MMPFLRRHVFDVLVIIGFIVLIPTVLTLGCIERHDRRGEGQQARLERADNSAAIEANTAAIQTSLVEACERDQELARLFTEGHGLSPPDYECDKLASTP